MTSKFLNFEHVGNSESGKTKVFSVQNKAGGVLGNIKYYAPWRRYCFIPEDGTLYDAACLSDIQNFITDLMKQRKKEQELNSK